MVKHPACGLPRLFGPAALLVAVAAGSAASQSPPVRMPTLPGITTMRATAPGDSTQAWASYLPSAYDGNAQLPVLFVLDPRGRGDLALALFAPAAERLGYIVMSSYNGRSDTLQSVSVAAINSMLDAAQHLKVDDRRMYFAGMSGTGRQAMQFALEARPHIAGVISAAAGLVPFPDPFEVAYARDSTIALFTSTGTADFNYAEVFHTEERLTSAGIPVRATFGTGGHGWPPEAVCAEALEWLELRAMRGGRRPLDSGWVAGHLQGRSSAAGALEERGQWDEARRAYDAIARDVPDWPQGVAAAAHAKRLASSREVRDFQRRLRRALDLEAGFTRRMSETLAALRREPAAEPPAMISRRLGLPDLIERAARDDSIEAPAMRRVLARMQAQLSFYEPRAYIAAGEHARAMALLATSELIRPLAGESCALLARARTGSGGETIGRSCGGRPPVP